MLQSGKAFNQAGKSSRRARGSQQCGGGSVTKLHTVKLRDGSNFNSWHTYVSDLLISEHGMAGMCVRKNEYITKGPDPPTEEEWAQAKTDYGLSNPQLADMKKSRAEEAMAIVAGMKAAR